MKEVQIVMLPIEKTEIHEGIWVNENNMMLYTGVVKAQRPNTPQHLYLTIDESTGAGDWVYDWFNNQIRKFEDIGTGRKIIATTNPRLWISLTRRANYYGIPKIPHDLVIEYVRQQGRLKKVLLEYTIITWTENGRGEEPKTVREECPKINKNGEVIWHHVMEKEEDKNNNYSRKELYDTAFLAFIGGYANKNLAPERLIEFFDEWFNRNHPI